MPSEVGQRVQYQVQAACHLQANCAMPLWPGLIDSATASRTPLSGARTAGSRRGTRVVDLGRDRPVRDLGRLRGDLRRLQRPLHADERTQGERGGNGPEENKPDWNSPFAKTVHHDFLLVCAV